MTEASENSVDLEMLSTQVDRSGLVALFANRVRARIIVVLLHTDEPLTVEEIATGANIYQSTVHEAIGPLADLDLLSEIEPEDSDDANPQYELATNELVEAVEQLAAIADEHASSEA